MADHFRIRVFSHSSLGVGSPSSEIKFEAPGSFAKNMKDKAIYNGITGGGLFFVAMIIMSVCLIKCLNKRKQRKTNKGTSH